MADFSLEPQSTSSRGCAGWLLGLLFVASLCFLAIALAWELNRGLGGRSVWLLGIPAAVAVASGAGLLLVQHGAASAELATTRPIERSREADPTAARDPAAPARRRSAEIIPAEVLPSAEAPSVPAPPRQGLAPDLRRAAIAGLVMALLPLLFFGFFFLFVIGRMGGGPPVLFFGVFIAVAMLMFGGFGMITALVVQSMARRMGGTYVKEIFEPFAHHVQGRLETPPPGLFGLQLLPPSVWFTHAGLPAVLKIETEGSGKHRVTYTTLEFTLAEASPSDLRVSPQGFLHQLGKWLGMQDLEVGDPVFDEKFVVQAGRPEAAAQFLNPAVRRALLDLSDWRRHTPPGTLGSTGHIDLALRGHSFKLRTLGFLARPDHLIGFYEASGRVLEAFLHTDAR